MVLGRSKLRSDLILLSVAFLWGGSFVLMRNAVRRIPEIPFLALRFTAAAVVLLLLFGKRLRGLTRKSLVQSLWLGVLLYVGMTLQIFGLRHTSAANSAFITGMNFVFVPILSALLLKKFPDRTALLGVCAAAAGLFFLTDGISASPNRGDVLTLISALVWAVQILSVDRFTREGDTLIPGVLQIVTAAVLFLLTWALSEPVPVNPLQPRVWPVILWTGLGCTAYGYAAQTAVQKHTTPTHAALILATEPVFGALFACLVPGPDGVPETLDAAKILGCLLMFAGMLICEFGDKIVLPRNGAKKQKPKSL